MKSSLYHGAWRSDVTLRGSWITPDPGRAAAIFFPMLKLWPWLVASVRASKCDIRSSAQRIQWNPLNGTPGACLYPYQLQCKMVCCNIELIHTRGSIISRHLYSIYPPDQNPVFAYLVIILSKVATTCGDTMWNLSWVVISSEKNWRLQLDVSISMLWSSSGEILLVVLLRTIRAYWSKRPVVTSSSFQN